MVGVNRDLFVHIGAPLIAIAQNRQCFYCARKMKFKDMTRDHLRPKRDGNTLALNCVMSCVYCNRMKGHRQPTEAEIERARKIYLSLGCPVFAI
jgi:5-methylcytosine-specific restriction endonuclease McrA